MNIVGSLIIFYLHNTKLKRPHISVKYLFTFYYYNFSTVNTLVSKLVHIKSFILTCIIQL